MVQDHAVMEHYFSRKPTTTLNERAITARLLGKELVFHTGSGVFSPDKIDLGTMILIENAFIEENWRVLDLACGYGPVGIALAKAHTIDLVMTDVNERAVSLARKNLKANHVTATTVQGDGYASISGLFDTILLNPPQTAGKQLCFQLIGQAKQFLKAGGMLQLVARHQKGGRELEKQMMAVFGNVKQVAKQSGYRVYVSQA